MSQTPRRTAARTLQIPDDVRAPLSEPRTGVTAYADADPALSAQIEARMAQIDATDTNSIVSFGAAAQGELQQISRSMLTDVKNKDVGPAGDSLRRMVAAIRGFSVSELDVRRQRSWWERLTGRMAPMARFVARFQQVQTQIDDVTDQLMGHEHQLMKDIKSLDMLYAKTLAFYDELALYIAAGEEKLRRLDAEDIPAKQAEIAAAGDGNGSGDGDGVMEAQQLRDLRTARDDLDRRVHDLKLTRQVTMQSLPSIRLVQENDKSLVTKINSTLVNTVPLWETQLAQAVTVQRSRDAAEAVRGANDLTNDLLRANARNLREGNVAVRTQIERGVFDIEAVRAANADLIATIEDSLRIADEGRSKRAAAESDLQRMEADLKQALSSARARPDAAAAADRKG